MELWARPGALTGASVFAGSSQCSRKAVVVLVGAEKSNAHIGIPRRPLKAVAHFKPMLAWPACFCSYHPRVQNIEGPCRTLLCRSKIGDSGEEKLLSPVPDLQLAVSAGAIQAWVGVVGALLGAVVTIFKYFRYQSRRDLRAAVGASFASTVDALASTNETSRMAGAVLLRRFFDHRTEQGAAGTPYVKETIELIAGMLRGEQPPYIQKVLSDGLRYAVDLQNADLQHCDLRKAYIGKKTGDERAVDLSEADLFESKCAGASFKEVIACNTVFYNAGLQGTVLSKANCEEADFRDAKCEEADFRDANCKNADFREANLFKSKFGGANIEGARFAGAKGIPDEVASLLDEDKVGRPGAVVPKLTAAR